MSSTNLEVNCEVECKKNNQLETSELDLVLPKKSYKNILQRACRSLVYMSIFASLFFSFKNSKSPEFKWILATVLFGINYFVYVKHVQRCCYGHDHVSNFVARINLNNDHGNSKSDTVTIEMLPV